MTRLNLIQDRTNSYCSVEEAFCSQMQSVLESGSQVAPRDLTTTEILGVTFRITNPRHRLVTNIARGWSLTYAIGELFWHLASSTSLEQIAFYSKKWNQFSDGDLIAGSCYGAKMFSLGPTGTSQWTQISDLLKGDPDSRRAVVSLYSSADLLASVQSPDIPCTCSLQFLVRDGKLNLITYMRSNDLMLGFGYDIFCFTMLQELMALELDLELGWYQHVVGSLHLYAKDLPLARKIADCGPCVQTPMPPMEHTEQISAVLSIERRIRGQSLLSIPDTLSPYWSALLQILVVDRLCSLGRAKEASALLPTLPFHCYYHFVDRLVG